MGSCVSCIEDQTDNDINTESDTNSQPDSVVPSVRAIPEKSEGTSSRGSTTVKKPVKQFTYRELEVATKGFREQNIIGRGGFGHVFRGRLRNGQEIAAKRLDESSQQGEEQFEVEIHMLSRLDHTNIVTLLGYCRDKRKPLLLVYEYLPLGSLDTHLYDFPPDRMPLDWETRMKIALGIAQGMEYLHDKTEQQIICRDFKSSNILLDQDFVPKISDFGLARYGPEGDNTHVSTRIMGTYGYCAPEYGSTGRLTAMSDVHSLGAVLLEIITGHKVIDRTRPPDERNLVTWVLGIMTDPDQFEILADPLLQGRYPKRSLNHALATAAMCLLENPVARPQAKQVIDALVFLQHPHDSDDEPSGSTSKRRRDDPSHEGKAKVEDDDTPTHTDDPSHKNKGKAKVEDDHTPTHTDDPSHKDKGKAKVEDDHRPTRTRGRSQGIRIGSPLQGIRIGSPIQGIRIRLPCLPLPERQGEGTSVGSGIKTGLDDVESQESQRNHPGTAPGTSSKP